MKPDRTQSEPACHLRNEAGFALPFTIFLVTLITIMLAAAFTRATADHQVASNSATEVSALAVAQSGLQSFIGDSFIARPMPPDSFRYNVMGGYAWVFPELMYQPSDTSFGFTYIIRSVGRVIHPTVGPDPQATRTVAQFARWNTAELPAPAAYVAINGIDHQPNSGHEPLRFEGADDGVCSPTHPTTLDYRGPDIDAVGDSDEPGNVHSEDTDQVNGIWSDVADEVGIDWDAIVNDSAVTPDFSAPLPGNTDYWTYLVEGNYNLPGISGTGLLIVTGDLTITSGFVGWEGVILVGGKLILEATSSMVLVKGIVVTGLNETIGLSTDPTELKIDDINYTFQYSSCSITQAMRRFQGFRALANTWVDNWATY